MLVKVKVDEEPVSLVKVPLLLIIPDKVWFALDEYANVDPDPIAIVPE